VQIDDAVTPLEERARRTDPHAGCVGALITKDGEEEAAGVGEGAFFYSFDPTAIHPDRDLVFGLTCDRARVTSDTFPEVDREPVIGHEE
jgi:hypothetical protein